MCTKFKNVLVAPDKFKGSLTSTQFCEIVKDCFYKFDPSINVDCVPLADGGEGSLECFLNATNAKQITGTFTNANFKKVKASYAMLNDVAFVELAQTAGLVNTKIKNPKITTTLGVGEQILDAINNGAKTIYLAIGGSATNDAGCGMAVGLGYKFFNKQKNEFVPTGKTLCQIETIVPPQKKIDAKVVVLCDVKNVLFGKNGAAYVYAKQKGANNLDIELLDENLKSFNTLCKKYGFNFEHVEGSGAAGGMGAGAMMFLNATLKSGVETFFELTNIPEKIDNADLIISGEGSIDKQSEFGKVVYSLLNKSKGKNKKFVAFCGVCKVENPKFEIIEINKPNQSLPTAIKNTKQNLIDAVNQFLNNKKPL